MISVSRTRQRRKVKYDGIGVSPFSEFILARLIRILSKYDGSLLIFTPAYVANATDGSGTVAVDGAIAYCKDLIKNTRPVTQATSTKRPLLKKVGSRWGAKFDGVDDVLLSAALASVAAETFGVVYTAPATTGSAQFPISRRNTANSSGSAMYLNGTTNSVNFLNASGTVAVGSVVAANNVAVASAIGKVGTVTQRVNMVEGAGVSYASYVASTNVLSIGNSVDSARAFSGTVHAIYYAPNIISAADIAVIDKLLMRLHTI